LLLTRILIEPMTHATDLKSLVTWMAGEFSNQPQAFENPPFFAHIRVFMRPVPIGIFPAPALFLEQAYDYALDQPYRMRVLTFVLQAGRLTIPHYRVTDEDAFRGAARDRAKLAQLTAADVTLMNGCGMEVDWTGHSFKGRVEPGKGCLVERKGQQTYLDNEFEILDEGATLHSLDLGRDCETDERVWGSVAGPFHFQRVRSFAEELEWA
jgi:CpeT/CpcT family (DUF1001)